MSVRKCVVGSVSKKCARSWLWQTRQWHTALEGLHPAIRIVAETAVPEPLLGVAAKHAFYSLGKALLTKLGAHLGRELHNTDSELSIVVSCVIAQLKLGVEEALNIARMRLGNNEVDQYFAAGLHETSCIEFLDTADHDTVRDQQSHDEKVGVDEGIFSQDYFAMMQQHAQSRARGRRPKALPQLLGFVYVLSCLCFAQCCSVYI